MNASILKVKKRHGKISPFVNGYNVWDISPENWTPDVQAAILHAYELGMQHFRDEVNLKMADTDCSFKIGTYWPEEKGGIK